MIDRNPQPNGAATLQAQLLDAVGEAVVAASFDGRVLYWNRAAERRLWWDAAEAAGRDVREVLAGRSESGKLLKALERVREGKTWAGDVVVNRKDGAALSVHLSASPIFDAAGSVETITFILCDVSSEKAAERAFRLSETRYRRIVETASEGIWLTDAAAMTIFVNRRMTEMLGYSEEEILGHSLIDFVEEDEWEPMAARFIERMNGKSDRYELRLRRRDGSRLWAQVSACPFYDESGAFGGSLAMFADISELKRAQLELIEARDRAEELAALKSAFLTNLSHEIRTPLTGIIGFSEMLRTEAAESERETAEMIHVSAKRLLVTLDALLNLAQLESGSVRLKPARLNVAEEVRHVFRAHARAAEARGLRLELEPQEAVVTAVLDRGALSNILSTLIGNALKFTDEGGVSVRIARDGDKLRIAVADTGIGIAPAFVPRVFDDFAQESAGLSRRFEGVGLGLPIAKRFAALLGGTLSVESEKGVGTTFTLEVPLG